MREGREDKCPGRRGMNGWTVFEAPADAAAAVLREEDGAATSVLICVNWERSRLPLSSFSLSALRIERRRMEGRGIPSPFLKVERKKRGMKLCAPISRGGRSSILNFRSPPSPAFSFSNFPLRGKERRRRRRRASGWGGKKKGPQFPLAPAPPPV